MPDLTSGTDWPHRGDKPLAFICQLDLAEVQVHLRDPAVPSAGLLSFFYEADRWTSSSSPEDRGAGRVLLTDGPVSGQRPPPLTPATAPPGYDPATRVFDEAGVVFSPRISLPDREHVLVDVFEMSDGEWEAYGALLDELRKVHGPKERRDGHNLPDLTQFLGTLPKFSRTPSRPPSLPRTVWIRAKRWVLGSRRPRPRSW